MIRFSTYSIYVDQFFLTKMWFSTTVSYKAENGAVNAGGTSSRTFAEDGDTLYLGQRPTLGFLSCVHMAHPWRKCWHIHLHFRS